MPSFDQETIERWRDERISSSRVPKGLDKWQIEASLSTCEADLLEEERRLQNSLLEAQISRSNIRSLKKKRDRILARKAETEGK